MAEHNKPLDVNKRMSSIVPSLKGFSFNALYNLVYFFSPGSPDFSSIKNIILKVNAFVLISRIVKAEEDYIK